jgi:hypothetical protein
MEMGCIARESVGGIDVIVTSEGLTEGWDISSVQVDGRNAIPKKGQYSSQEEAVEEAFKLGEKFKLNN